jgi:hypothetical protein
VIAQIARSAVWGAVAVVALDVILILSIELLNFCYSWVGLECWAAGATSTFMRLSFVLHPIANIAFNAIILTHFHGHDLGIHTWTPPAYVVAIFYGLLLLEAAFYGALLGAFASVLRRIFSRMKAVNG